MTHFAMVTYTAEAEMEISSVLLNLLSHLEKITFLLNTIYRYGGIIGSVGAALL